MKKTSSLHALASANRQRLEANKIQAADFGYSWEQVLEYAKEKKATKITYTLLDEMVDEVPLIPPDEWVVSSATLQAPNSTTSLGDLVPDLRQRPHGDTHLQSGLFGRNHGQSHDTWPQVVLRRFFKCIDEGEGKLVVVGDKWDRIGGLRVC